MGAFERYQEGKFVSGTEWTEDIERAWQVTHDLDDGKAVDQLGLDGDHYYRLLKPEIVLTPGQEHLLRTDGKVPNVLPLPPKLDKTP